MAIRSARHSEVRMPPAIREVERSPAARSALSAASMMRMAASIGSGGVAIPHVAESGGPRDFALEGHRRRLAKKLISAL